MKTKQRNQITSKPLLRSYLAVTAGVGCASCVAEGAIQVVDLSGLSTPGGSVNIVALPGGDAEPDIFFGGTFGGNGGLFTGYAVFFYGVSRYVDPGAYRAGSMEFPTVAEGGVLWYSSYLGGPVGGFEDGADNWVAFRDSENRFGWLQLSLDDASAPNASAGLQLLNFAYDPDATSAANAPNLSEAVAAVNAVPEPSSLALLALGATGLAAHRKRKAA